MRVDQFIGHIRRNGKKCPYWINPIRWAAMLKWMETRNKLKERLITNMVIQD